MKSIVDLMETNVNERSYTTINMKDEEISNAARQIASKLAGGKEDKNANVMARYFNPGQLTDMCESLGTADILACYFIHHPELSVEFAKALTLAAPEDELQKMADRVLKIF